MESERFDGIVRRLGTGTDRRAAVKGLAAAVAGLGVARMAVPAEVAADEVETERCGGKRDRCFRNHDCCQGLKCKNGNPDTNEVGYCKFKNNHGGRGDWCKKDSDCDNRYICERKRCR